MIIIKCELCTKMAIKKSEKTCRTSNKISHVDCKTNVKLGAILKLGHQVALSYRYRIVKIDIQIGAIEFAPIRNWGKSQVGAQQELLFSLTSNNTLKHSLYHTHYYSIFFALFKTIS